MTDDTPTQRLPEDPDDTPTQRLPPGADGTPTQRLPQGSDDLPTQRLPQGPDGPAIPGSSRPSGAGRGDGVPSESIPPDAAEAGKKSRAVLFTLIGVGVALLIAIVVLLVLLVTRDDEGAAVDPTTSPTATETESPSPEPTQEPEPQPEPTPEPPPAPSAIVSFTVDKTSAGCTSATDEPPITFNWNTTGTSVDFGIGTERAEQNPYDSFPPVGGTTVAYQCSEEGSDQIYSIAAIFNGEVIGRQTITVTD